MQPLFAWIKRRSDELLLGTYPAQPAALFRIGGALVALADLFATKRLALLIWDPGPAQPVLSFAYWTWALSLVALLFGYRTTLAAWVNYVCTFALIQGIRPVFEYHLDYYVHTWAFYLLLLRSGTVFSIDAALESAKRKAAGLPPLAPLIPMWPVTLFMVQFSLDYFDAGMSKLHDFEMWRAGLGLYWPLVVRYGSTGLCRWVIDWKFLIVNLGAFSFYWEISFPLLMCWKPLRMLALIFGTLFHIGIVVLLPIHFFGEFMLALYLLLVPWPWLERLANKLRGRPEPAAPPPVAPRQFWELRSPRLPRWVVGVAVALLLVAKLGHLKVTPEPVRRVTSLAAKQVNGFVIHTVFMAHHFRNQRVPIVEIRTARGWELMPFMRRDGYPGPMIMKSTRLWVYMLRMGQSATPEKFATLLADWVERTRPDACGLRLSLRHVVPPPTYAGDVDVWTHAPTERVIEYSFDHAGCTVIPSSRQLRSPVHLLPQ
jgi:hypothetical protein